MNSAENIQVRRDDAPGATRQLVIDDVTFAESVLMYEALRCIRDAHARGLGFSIGVVGTNQIIVIDGVQVTTAVSDATA